ncbi:MAG: hypothetical protein E7379_03100 [Clostridiales bacterium]|nr:hypothetical protein [Clostridiales bacterium]
MKYIKYTGIPKEEILYCLYLHAKTSKLGFFVNIGNRTINSVQDAKELLSHKTDFDYIDGRPIKIDLADDDKFYAELYDVNNGEGAAFEAVKYLINDKKLKYRANQISEKNFGGVDKIQIDPLDEFDNMADCIYMLLELNKQYEANEVTIRNTLKEMCEILEKNKVYFSKYSGLNTLSSLFFAISNIVSHQDALYLLNNLRGRQYKAYYSIREDLMKFAREDCKCPEELMQRFEFETNTFAIEENHQQISQ